MIKKKNRLISKHSNKNTFNRFEPTLVICRRRTPPHFQQNKLEGQVLCLERFL